MTEPIRYHPENGLPLHWDGQQHRVLAALPGRAAYAALAPWHESAREPILPRSLWRECSLRSYTSPVLDQGSTSSCVGHATAAAFRRAWSLSGQQDYPFSPYYCYGLVDHDQDAGAIVGDAVDAISRWGVAYDGPLSDGDLPHAYIKQTQLMGLAAVLAKASRFRPQISWHLQPGASVFDQVSSAIQAFCPTVFGVMIYRNFSQLAPDGGVPAPAGNLLGGHALHGCGLRYNRRLSKWEIETQNSWSEKWGLGGICYLGEEYFTGQVDAFAIGAVAEDPAGVQGWPDARAA
jgi:hypothetical protein